MERFVTTDEVAQLLGVGRSTVYKLVKTGALPAPVRISAGVVRFWLPALLDAAQRRADRPTLRALNLKPRRRARGGDAEEARR